MSIRLFFAKRLNSALSSFIWGSVHLSSIVLFVILWRFVRFGTMILSFFFALKQLPIVFVISKMDLVVLTVIDIETTENIPKSQLGCYISLENAFVDLITPIREEIHEHSLLHIHPENYSDHISFIVKVMGSIENNVGSVKVPVSALAALATDYSDVRGYSKLWFTLSKESDDMYRLGE
jgi:hypothetical protein